VAVVVLAW